MPEIEEGDDPLYPTKMHLFAASLSAVQFSAAKDAFSSEQKAS